jgi:hypothetical protein
MNTTTHIRPSLRIAAVALVAGIGLAACGSSSSNGTGSSSKTTAGGASTQVLPVTTNPIKNTSTVKALEITSVLVEDNVDADTGKAADDHLEVALKNTGSAPLTNVEVFYTFTDTKTSVAESYYTKLPASFTVPANGDRIAHFDNTGETDHFPVNKYSIYATSKNALDVDVTVSAAGAAIATKTAKKDAGGSEVPGE